MKKLGDSQIHPLNLSINKQIQRNGCPLSELLTDENEAVVRHGNFNMVVMQEGGDLTHKTSASSADEFYKYAKRWAEIIRESGATPVLYMMWAWREEVGPAMLTSTNFQADRYDTAARLIHAKVIPIGRGFYKVRTDTSAIAKSIDLFLDYQHPSACGTYFIGCICFCALYNLSPVGNAYLGGDICSNSVKPKKKQAAYLQRVAWETWQQYGGDDGGRAYVPATMPGVN